MDILPAGTVTFVFTDLEGSTNLVQHLGARYATVLADHHRLLRTGFQHHGGEERDTQGDGLFYTFPSARAALHAAVSAQRAVLAHRWPEGVAVRVRMGIHTGEPVAGETGYVGLDVHRAARICAAGWGGQILVSQTTRTLLQDDDLDGIALRDLGEHRLKDLARPERLFQVAAADLPSDFPPLRSLDRFLHNLPVQLTGFVGRQREMAEVCRLLAAARLLTLTGVGGCGKTRLALQVAAEVTEEYAQGVWLVELAALADPRLVPQSVATVLGVREERDRALIETLVAFLRGRSTLLVLDNCEHVLSSCADLVETLLRRCPSLRVLSTSREGLGVPGEALYAVQSLRVPDPPDAVSADSVTSYEAVRLFVDRAAARQPAFAVTDQNAISIAQVCSRLDGIPLAIELAVARLPALSVEQLAHRLDDRFRLLTGGMRTALPRHQTLQALIDWSHDLLSTAERALLRRLAVFAGGWTLAAAEVVCASDGIAQADVLDLLTGLVNKSLVIAEERSGEVRYRYLDTIRQYAREKLVTSEETDQVRDGHLAFFLQFAETFEGRFRTAEQLAWVRSMEAEFANVRTALEWARASSVDAGVRLAGALFRFWYLRGHLREARGWLEELLSKAAPARVAPRAKVLRALAMIARDLGEFPAARALFEESRGIYQELGDQHGVVDVLLGMGLIPRTQGDLAASRALCEEGLALSREIGYAWGVAESLHLLGHVVHSRGEYGQALGLFEESVEQFRAIGNRWSLAHPLTDLGREALRRGHYARARAVFEESLDVFQDFGGKASIAMLHADLGEVALAEGDFHRAREHLEQSLQMSREIGTKEDVAETLITLADVALHTGDLATARALAQEALDVSKPLKRQSGIAKARVILGLLAYYEGDGDRATGELRESLSSWESGDTGRIARALRALAYVAASQTRLRYAARLFGASEALTEAIGARVHACDRPEYERVVASVRAALGDSAFAAGWREGRAMSLEQAVALALADASVT